MELTIKSPDDYDMISSVHSWIFPDVQPVPERSSSTSFWRVYTFDDISTPVKVTQQKAGQELRTEWDNESLSSREIKAKIEIVLNLKMDMKPILMKFAEIESIASIAEKVKGIRPYLADTVFEALIKTIIQQQISYRAANVITKRLIHKTASPRQAEADTYAFPTPHELISLGDDGLRKLGIGYKSPYILGVCKSVVIGQLHLEELRGKGYQNAREELIPFKGIGEWTVDVLAIAGLGEFSVFPYGDLGIQNILGNLCNDGNRLKTKEVKSISDQWGKEGPMILYLLMCAGVLGYL